nr:protein kinase [Caldimonas sp.]
MDPKDLSGLSELLDVALELADDDARAAWLAQLPVEHERLRPALERLLQLRAQPLALLDAALPLATAASETTVGLQTGRMVGPYRLVRPLGSGGMSEVWLAEMSGPTGPRLVALKLPAVSLDRDAFLARFARECEFLRQLDHPGIAALVDAGVTDDGQHYLALEYVEGSPLGAYCDRQRLGLAARLALFRQVLEPVRYAHSRSILHRDLKPSNIFVTAQGAVRLLDFGIAKLLVDGHAVETELTARWGRALTRDYASPEQLEGKPVTVCSDVYSLGVVLFELVCGRRPSIASSRGATDDPTPEPPLASESCRADAVVAACAGGAEALARRLRGPLDALIARALNVDPRDRYPDVASFAAAVDAAMSQSPLGSLLRRAHASASRTLRQQAVAAAVATLALVAVATRGGAALSADLETALAAPLPERQRVVIVSIGPQDHDRLFGTAGPLDADVVRRLVARIVDGGPAVVGVDLDTSAAAFAQVPGALSREESRLVVWARDIAVSEDGTPPSPRPMLGAAESVAQVRSGLALLVVDGPSGRVRWFRRSVPTADAPLPSFAAEIARGQGALAGAAIEDPALRNVRVTRTSRLEVPASVVLAPGFEWRDRIRGRVVLLGGRYDPTDVHPTSIGPMQGVELLANVVETEIAGRDYRRPAILSLLAIGLLDLLATMALVARWGAWRGNAGGIASGLALAGALAATDVFPAWPFAVVVAITVSATHLAVSALREQRAPIARMLRRAWQRVAGHERSPS